jgi:aspartate-semialdehyde dehydrogenase
MNANGKTAGLAHADATRGFYRVAIVGAASLKGKEVAEMLEQRNFPSTEIKLLDDDETLGQLEALKDEITFIQSIRAEQFERMDFTFFASDAASTLKNWKQARDFGSAIIDLSYALEAEPGAAVRAPWFERQSGVVSAPDLQPGPAVIAHPAAVVLALLLGRTQAVGPIVHASAVVLDPASEYAQKGMDELHQQTINLLSFQPLPKKIFDVQIAFNMISRFGEESQKSVSAVTERIVRHYQKITGNARIVVPSVLTLQAPVFHGHALAVNLQFERDADVATVALALAGEHVSVVPSSQEAPNNVNAAGQNEVLVSVAADNFNPKSVWLWGAFDNLRVAAAAAVECAESMAATRPRGGIQ